MPSLVAIVEIFIFFGSWMGGVSLVPAIVLLWLATGNTIGFWLLAAYYSYRAFVPRRRWQWLHKFQATTMSKFPYFARQELVLETPLPPDDGSLLVVHPHGVLTMGFGVIMNMSPELLPSEVHFMVTDVLLSLPLISDFLSWYNVGASGKAAFTRRMAARQNLAFLPGGFEEATLYERGRHRVFLRRRKGFIKYALQHGYKLRPCYCFGEEHTYWGWPWAMRQLAFLNAWKLPAVVFLGRLCTFMPDERAPMAAVVGAPLALPRIEQPTDADVDAAHAKYVEALRALFERQKAAYAHEGHDATLEVL